LGAGGSPIVDWSIELDELVEKWTLLEDERGLVAGKRGTTRRTPQPPVPHSRAGEVYQGS
jgi:hypothetical protein